MRKVFPLILVLVLAIPVMGQLTTGPDNSPKVGDLAPDFQIPSAQRGAPPSSLKDFQGKKNVLLMFFPAAFTQGCTTEFTEAGVNYDKFTTLNIEMLGISRDQLPSLNKFKETVGAKNAFVSDVELQIAPKYDAKSAGSTFKRSYFLIDQTGKIVWKSTTNTLIPTDKLLTDLGQVLKK